MREVEEDLLKGLRGALEGGGQLRAVDTMEHAGAWVSDQGLEICLRSSTVLGHLEPTSSSGFFSVQGRLTTSWRLSNDVATSEETPRDRSVTLRFEDS